MLQPPKDVEPSELFRKLLEMPKPSEVIDFPRKDASGNPISQIRMTVLSSAEHDLAREKATVFFKGKGYSPEDLKSVTMKEVLGDRIAKELLVLSCFTAKEQLVDKESGDPIYGKIFHNADEIGQLQAQEIEVLFNAYLLVQHKFGPREDNTDVDAWIARLEEGGQHYPLLSLDLPELVDLTSSLAARISTIYSVLGSQWQELPDTCQLLLERCCGDTISSTSHPVELDEQTSAKSVDLDLVDALELGKKRRSQALLSDATDENE